MSRADNSYSRDGPSPATLTSASLLDKVKEGDAAGWQRLTDLYRPLVLWWCRHRVARRDDAEDVVQEVLATVLTRVGAFDRQRPGSFRAWLKTITQFKLLEYWKDQRNQPVAAGGSEAKEALERFPQQLEDSSTESDEASERRILLQSALELLRTEFEAKTWQAAMRTVEGQRAAAVAADLGMTRDAVYIAKSRVLARLRKEMAELLD
jgi:RNA polymerase sigma-70 factor (ECF subfamily)